jgi:hypothetical protein
MMTSGLSLQQAPPLSVPGRFFLIAPVFGAVAALILIFHPQGFPDSRWTGAVLAVTHCLALGFFTSIMIGALQQMLPVLAGAFIPRPRLIAGIVWWLWLPGILCLIGGFLHMRPWLFAAAAILAGGALITFLAAVIAALLPAEAQGDSVSGIRFAILALTVTLILGILLAAGYAGLVPLWRPVVTDLHLSWGLPGWIGALVIAIAWQVVPMFQITQPYPQWFRRSFVPVMFVLLAGKSVCALIGNGAISIMTLIDLAIAATLVCFALLTLQLQFQSKRRIRDSHRDFWRLGMVHLIAACACWIAAELTGRLALDLLTAVLFLMGFAMSVVTGMLLKILSFLIWLHLSELDNALTLAGKPGVEVPKMKSVINNWVADRLLQLLLFAQALLLLAFPWPSLFIRPAALAWLVFFFFLGWVVARVLLRYREIANAAQIEG